MPKSSFTRRKYQARRRAKTKTAKGGAEKKNGAENKPQGEKLQNVLGLISMSGYNKNVLPLATALTKTTRANYLTKALANKKMNAIKTRQGEKLQNILGLTAAVGYNENVLPLAAGLSKKTRSNYLTSSLVNKKVEHARRQ